MKCRILLVCWGVACLFASLNSAFAQGTAFTYQGNLSLNSAPANGSFDMQFTLRPQPTGNNQVGSVLTNAPTGVTNGLFTVVLDFGNVFTTNPLYLEIGLRTNGSTSVYTVLAPTQLITSAPYAVEALSAKTVTGQISDTQLSTNVPLLNSNEVFTGHASFSNATGFFNGTLSGTFSGAASGTFNGTATGTFNGNGANVTNLNVTNLTGVVQSNPNWQLVQSSPQQAVVANNYLTTNAALTTLILPANPNVGSTLRFAGSGGNGWVITNNPGQSILTAPLGLPAGQNWSVAYNSSQSWHALAASANGLRLAAGFSTGIIYYSSDGGLTWTASDSGSQAWSGIACSSDGLRMVAAPNNTGSYIFTSINGGAHWTQQTGGLTAGIGLHSVASSADGVNLIAATDSGLGAIYTSSNGGTNWTTRISGQNWAAVASSSEGNHLAAAPNGASIYTSSDSGVTWTNHGPSASWSSIASSADGGKLVASVSSASTGFIYTSGDGGVTWTPRATNQTWTCVASSADGMNLAAAYSLGYIYTSSDAGQTWMQRTNNLPNGAQSWAALSSSANGSRLTAAISTGLIYNSVAATTIGSGTLTGAQYSNIELQYIGNGQWMPLSAYGTFTGN